MFPSPTNIPLINQINKASGFGAGVPALPGAQASGGAKPLGGTTGRPSAPQYQSSAKGGTSSGVARAAATIAPDPYAQWGGQANFDRLRSGFTTQDQNIHGTASEAADNAGIGIRSSILDLVDTLRSGQNKIDNEAVQNELAKITGTRGVNDMVGRGIQSGGVLLGNNNAANSSGAEALARAYGDIGRRELSSVGNQYQSGLSTIANEQTDLDTTRSQGIRHVQDSKTQTINQIVSDARGKLAQLDASMVNASMPDRINIDAEKEQVRQDAINRLAQYDQLLSDQTNAIKPMDEGTRRAKGFAAANAGVAPENAFKFTAQAPAQFAGTGPLPSELPIFTAPKPKGNDQQGVA